MVRESWDLAVIGGGAAGMAAAIAASDLGDRVVLIEKSSFLGKKITASGNGRCNLMNLREPVYYGDSGFAKDVLESFGREDLRRFWNGLGLCLSEETEGRIYPSTFQSASVLDALKTRLKANRVEIFLQTPVRGFSPEDNIFRIDCGENAFFAKRVIVAAGGPASPKLGGTDDGYRLLKEFGHTIIPAAPALCPLVTDKRSVSGLSGIRCRCGISLYGPDGTLLHTEKGEVLFTDSGISGICAMQCARFVQEGCRAELDLVERIFPDNQTLFAALKERREKAGEFPPETVCTGFLLPKLAFAVLKQAGIETRGRTAGDLKDEELKAIAERVHHYSLQVTGTRGLEEAQVTAGGAECAEFDPSTMESRLKSGLHAAGEVLNVDGDCGGFNLMFVFASGILAGRNGRKGEQP